MTRPGPVAGGCRIVTGGGTRCLGPAIPLLTIPPGHVAQRSLVFRGVSGHARSGVSSPAGAGRHRARRYGCRNRTRLHLPAGGPQKGGPPSRWRALAPPAARRQRSNAGGDPGGADARRSTFPPPAWCRNLPPTATARRSGPSSGAGTPGPPAPCPWLQPTPSAAALP